MELSVTQQKIIEILTERVGHNLVDSGGAYGYQHDRNEQRSLFDEPQIKVEFEASRDGQKWWANPRVSLAHFLNTFLEYDPQLDEMFQATINEMGKDASWFRCVENFLDILEENDGLEWYDPVNGESDRRPQQWYTYNDETILDQDLAMWRFNVDGMCGDSFMIIMVHNGCDARWGFTSPVLFRLPERSYEYLYNALTRWSMAAQPPEDTDNQLDLPMTVGTLEGWYVDMDNGSPEESSDNAPDLDKVSTDPEDRGKGKMFIDEDGNAYCPIYGTLIECYASLEF